MTRDCRYCGRAFEPPHRETTLCRDCWWRGRHLEDRHPALLKAVRELVGEGAIAEFSNMGGNTRALSIVAVGPKGLQLDHGRFIATVAVQEDDGTWRAESGLPDPGEPWAVGLYPNTDADTPTVERCPVTEPELIAFIREHRRALKVRTPIVIDGKEWSR